MCLRVLCVRYCVMEHGVVLFVLYVCACVLCLHGLFLCLGLCALVHMVV